MSGNKQSIIKVCDGDKIINLPLNSQGNIEISFLKIYFNNAEGLTYQHQGEIFAVLISNGELIIDKNVYSYQVISKISNDLIFEHQMESPMTPDRSLSLIEAVSNDNILRCVEHQPIDTETIQRDQLIHQYHKENYRYNEIVQLLAHRHNIHLSLRHLERILMKFGLKRKNKIDSPLVNIVAVILEELSGSGSCLGYKALWQRIKQKYNLHVKRDTVREILTIADPDGILQRSRKRLRRRKYTVPGPNFLWHVDGYDKLKPFGFAIHGCIDGYSRKILWLNVASSNNNPAVIAHYFLNTVKRLSIVPKLLRSDLGTENCRIESLQQSLRFLHTDNCAGIKSFIKGRSTSNQRIESYWSQMRRSGVDFWISFFKDMRATNIFNDSIPCNVACLQYCFGPLIQQELHLIRKEWNNHRIRKQRNIEAPAGVPNLMFHCPSENNTHNFGKSIDPYDEADIDVLLDNLSVTPELFPPLFSELVELLLPNSTIPSSPNDALSLYKLLLHLIEVHNVS